MDCMNVRANMRDMLKLFNTLKQFKQRTITKNPEGLDEYWMSRFNEIETEAIMNIVPEGPHKYWMSRFNEIETEVMNIDDDYNQLGTLLSHVKCRCAAIENSTDMEESEDEDDMVEVEEEEEGNFQTDMEESEDEVTNIDDNDYAQLFPGCLISRRAAKVAEDVRMLLNIDFTLPQGMPCSISFKPTIAPSTDVYLRQVFDYLLDEEVGVVGVWGTAGVGKTTLLRKVNNHCRDSHSYFDYVIWVIVSSQEPDLYELQMDIAKKVGLNLDGETLETGAELLRSFLEGKSFLILLDEMSKPIDLSELGVPWSSSSGKVVFTTRTKQICNQIIGKFRKFQFRCPKIKIHNLKREAAWGLFLRNLAQSIHSDSSVRSAKEVANKCRGLPLALVVIARSMSAQKTCQEWEDAINSLQNTWAERTSPFHLLKVSYDLLLDDSKRNCFLCLALWPKNYEIEENQLVSCWLGMNLIDESDDISAAYRKGNSVYEYLKKTRLFEKCRGKYDGPISSVKMHDVIHEMARWILSNCEERSRKWMVLNGDELNGGSIDLTKWREAKVISLVKGKSETILPEHVPDCPNLSVLMLHNIFLHQIPEGFLQNMYALTYLDLSSNKLSNIPQAICSLLLLQFLNLSHNLISSLPIELSRLEELKYLILRHNSELRSIPRGLISALEKLELLDLFDTGYDGWGREFEASIEEFQICLRTRHLRIDISRLDNLEQLSEEPCLSLEWLNLNNPEGVTTLSLSKSLLQIANIRLSLPLLRISNSDSLEEIETDSKCLYEFESLLQLELYHLSNLRKIGMGRTQLQSIRTLIIDGCEKLKNITSILQLPILKTLEVGYCAALEEVIGDEEVGESSGVSQVARTGDTEPFWRCTLLRYLICLHLCNLPVLSTFSTRARPVFLRNLKFLDVNNCPNLDKNSIKYVHRDTPE